MIRREERLRSRVEVAATERVRVRRVIVTEQRTITVDVRREEIHITREPLIGASASTSPGHADRTPIVLIRHEEQIRVTKTVVPVERVTVAIIAVTEDQNVTATVARDVIETVVQATGRVST